MDDAVDEDAPYEPQSELIWVLLIGSILSFVGTPIAYIWYASTEQDSYHARLHKPLPLVTDMFTNWPLISGTLFGVGMSMLFIGILATAISRIPNSIAFQPRTVLVQLCILSTVGVWLVLASCGTQLPQGTESDSDWLVDSVHHASTLVLMVSAIYSLHEAAWICRYFADHIGMQQKKDVEDGSVKLLLWAVSVSQICALVAVSGIVGATVSVLVATLAAAKPVPMFLWQMLAFCEIVVLGFGGVGYFLVIYAYAIIEKGAIALV